MILLDDRINLKSAAHEFGGASVMLRKRSYPIPVKIHGEDAQSMKKNLIDAIQHFGMLLTGGQEFIVRIGKTESMGVKEIVKNVV